MVNKNSDEVDRTLLTPWNPSSLQWPASGHRKWRPADLRANAASLPDDASAAPRVRGCNDEIRTNGWAHAPLFGWPPDPVAATAGGATTNGRPEGNGEFVESESHDDHATIPDDATAATTPTGTASHAAATAATATAYEQRGSPSRGSHEWKYPQEQRHAHQ